MAGDAKHSPEPWRIIEPDPGKGQRWAPGVDDGHGDAVLWEGIEVAPCDMRRLVACVNALAGVPTEALEAGALAEVIEAAESLCTPRTSKGDEVAGWEIALLRRRLVVLGKDAP